MSHDSFGFMRHGESIIASPIQEQTPRPLFHNKTSNYALLLAQSNLLGMEMCGTRFLVTKIFKTMNCQNRVYLKNSFISNYTQVN